MKLNFPHQILVHKTFSTLVKMDHAVPNVQLEIVSKCSTSLGRTAFMKTSHFTVETPVFMPVGTQGTIKGLLPEQLIDIGLQIMLSNTYHLGTRPGPEVLKKAGGLHKFMNWPRALLTDSGGFQMVSLMKLSNVTEDGVNFQSPFDESQSLLLTPEESIRIQNAIGADIVMQLDDVLKTTTPIGPRVEEATYRTTRWLDRCLAAHQRPHDQSIFPIVQGLLDPTLRKISVQEHKKRDVNGFAIGGMSGGESKNDFWRIVLLCTSLLPPEKPRYLMGVGYTVDMIVCIALGIDMFDCVFPTRTARFGCALINTGQMNLKLKQYENDYQPIDSNCSCITCKRHTRAYLHSLSNMDANRCHLLTIHNLSYYNNLMKSIRESLIEDRFPHFVKTFMKQSFPEENYPNWVIDALRAVNIYLKSDDDVPGPLLSEDRILQTVFGGKNEERKSILTGQQKIIGVSTTLENRREEDETVKACKCKDDISEMKGMQIEYDQTMEKRKIEKDYLEGRIETEDSVVTTKRIKM